MIHSDVYNRLVKNNDNIAELVAYGIYKQAKQEFIKRKQQELNIEILPDEVMEEFVASQTDYILGLYRKYADEATREFLATETESVRKEIQEKAEKEKQSEMKDFVKNFSPKSWWYGVAQSFVASFLFLLAGYAILKMSGSWDILLNNLFR